MNTQRITPMDMSATFPANKNKIRGEEYITFDYNNPFTRWFEVICDKIDSTLIRSANAIKNELVLQSGDVVTGLYFEIYPTSSSSGYKEYFIKSFPKLKENNK